MYEIKIILMTILFVFVAEVLIYLIYCIVRHCLIASVNGFAEFEEVLKIYDVIGKLDNRVGQLELKEIKKK